MQRSPYPQQHQQPYPAPYPKDIGFQLNQQPQTVIAMPQPPSPPPMQQPIPPNMPIEGQPAFNVFFDTSGAFANGFSTKEIRSAFAAKVYLIVCFQLMFTLICMSVAMFVDPVTEHLMKYGVYYIAISGIIALVTLLPLICCQQILRNFPLNYIVLADITICFSIMVSAMVVRFTVNSVLIAVGLTFAVCVIVYLMAAFSPIDMSNCCPVLYALLIAHSLLGLLLGLILIPLGYFSLLNILYNTAGALIFSLFLWMDLQLVMGDRSRAISPEDYIIAAINIYLDVINIFVHILMAVGDQK